MSDVIIWIDMEPYLRQWYIHDGGGNVPVRLKKGGPDSNLLRCLLRKQPPGAHEETEREGAVPIVVPYYRGKNIQANHYLDHDARVAFHNHVRNRFQVELWKDLHKTRFVRKRKQDLIYAWMEKHGIEDSETNYFAIQKIYQRLRKDENKEMQREREKKTKGKRKK